MEIKIESTVKGTFISLGDEKRDMINRMVKLCQDVGFQEISIPILQFQETFQGKVGGENQKMMYAFLDAGGRKLCLAPEYTAVIMQLAKTTFKFQKDVMVFYVGQCFRGEKPQAGRYRQFTQFGVEIINPTKDYALAELAENLIKVGLRDENVKLQVDKSAVRGLDYYKEGKGFEIRFEELGAQKQICGGGEYPGGVGFAIGIDRLLLMKCL